MFTRSSVHCAERIVATSNSSGLRWSRLHFAVGYVFFKIGRIAATRARRAASFADDVLPLAMSLRYEVGITIAARRFALNRIIPASNPTMKNRIIALSDCNLLR